MRRIVILNGNPKQENVTFDDYCDELRERLIKKGNEVNLIKLRERKIGDCIGCFSCWLKTPGICALKDDHEAIMRAYVNSGLVILASPIMMGFVSSDLKRTTDRLLPLNHPFLRVNGDRMAHYNRYERTARVGLLLEKSETYDERDLKLVNATYGYRDFIRFTDEDMEAVVYEAHAL